MFTARQIDLVEQELTHRGEAFFHVSGAGHEGSAVLALHLTSDDWLHCHYRDKALLIARGITPRGFFDSLLCKQESHSRGRQMSAHMSDPALNVLSIVGPVGNSALQAVGVAAAIKDQAGQPIVLCSVGDGTTQEGEFLEACGEAVRDGLPVMFFVEDNRWAISTTTREKTFYSHPGQNPADFYGMPIHRVNGRDVITAFHQLGEVVDRTRRARTPSLTVFDVERLTSHTNADDQRIYRDDEDIRRSRDQGDPIQVLEQHLLQSGVDADTLQAIQDEVTAEVASAEAEASAGSDPEPVLTAKQPIHIELTHPSREVCGHDGQPRLTMKDALCEVLGNQLRDNPRVILYGEDIEDPKGDVFGVTKGLSSQFPGRVRNAPLAEATILGVSIGRALAGDRPVAFLQFADFLPLAYNQIVSELGSMYWRTDGGWTAPVIVMIPCGGYRPGLGPFHSHSLESIAAHTPGVDVFMPSTAGDAAGLLNAAFASTRPTLLFYPKSCLNDPSQTTSADVDKQLVPIGTTRKVRAGRDITLVGWGNTVRLCQRAAEALEQVAVEAEILDMRSISPWDEHAVLTSAENTARLIVVHEDNHTCGFGAEVLATVAEKARVPVAMRRVTRPDTFVPCNFANQLDILPSFQRVLSTAAELLDLDLSWVAPQKAEAGVHLVEAIGSGPSDEMVTVVALLVRTGMAIKRGDVVASLEATKSVFELSSPVSGTVDALLVEEGDTVAVGAPLMRILCEQSTRQRAKPITRENPGTPVLARRPSATTIKLPHPEGRPRRQCVGIGSVATVPGSRRVTNAELAAGGDNMSAADILRRTGIECRHWAGPDETAVDMAARACWHVLEQENLIIDDINLIVCSTTSPTAVTPSTACQILNRITRNSSDAMLQAFDINAACSGYLYALQSGYDYLQSAPEGRVLVVTAELLSPLLDPKDFDTAIIFSDAASATILYGEDHIEHAKARLLRPELSARGEDGTALSVPFPDQGFIRMHGRKVFSEAVRTMLSSLNRVCAKESMQIDDLDLIVPHQANGRIIEAMRSRIGVDVYSNIRMHGNTSSTSIPLCLSDVLPHIQPGQRVGLCAFGGGFTFGAGILEAA